MLHNIVKVLDEAGDSLYVIVREDDHFAIVNNPSRNDFDSIAWENINKSDTQKRDRCWSHVFLDSDEELITIATELKGEDLLRTIKMDKLLSGD